MNDREQALFEAGIKLGALYHQYVGAPLDLNTILSRKSNPRKHTRATLRRKYYS